VSRRLFTSESVTEGHPDKIADQISDAILDAMLKDDAKSRVAVETMITTGQVHVAGEVTTETYVDIPGVIREKILDIGYDSSSKGFDGRSCGVSVSIGAQSPDIAQGVDDAYESREGEGVDDLDRQGAGDQGLMFGYACRETPELMPLPITLAHRLAAKLSAVRNNGVVPYLRPDGKTQVTIEYDGDRPVRLDTVVVSSQHAPDISLSDLLTPDIKEHVVDPVLADLELDTDGYRLLVNPTGRFEIGGPMGDAGLTEKVPTAKIQEAVLAVFDLRPAAIIRDLDLLRPIYSQTAAYGHFGREEPDFSWETTHRADSLRSAAGL
jgi:S-adenosylmethionine synthetase